jgi:outer membrane protein assembly factor BamB
LVGVPAFASNTVYALGRDDRLYAFEASGGRLRWAAGTTGVRISYPGPVVSGGRVYVVQNDAEGDHLYAFDAASGATAWSAAPDSYYSFSGAPAVVGNVVYAVALGGNPYYDGHVYALDAASGARLWLGQAYTNGIGGWPTVAGGRVYAPAGEGNWTEVFRASSGAYLGRREGAGTITVGNGVGYADSFDAIELLSAWNERTGSVLWHRGGDNEPLIPGGSALANGVLYVTTDYGRLLYALDAASGQTLAKITIGTGAYGSFSPPVVADGVVYLSSDGNIEAIGLPKT